ncbi:hypothetical protein CS0771_53370 [Catellatospora sp. IY07-71]|uniref:hypothetical protein n=1 Tax=Catellatospora sp. IY07-71 TaxID=2728827 RepID=UPI001BB37920|nr:hypothetical protein [Catellatospora sp. IY07-71]BCJ75793.1 hypothetical protein CS0771_53370 [Catellatospora sp. IY07-71]
MSAGGRSTTGTVRAVAGAPVVVTFDDAALAFAHLPRLAALRTAAARLAPGRIEVRRADGTWLARFYQHGGRGHVWWSAAGLAMLPRTAFLRVSRFRPRFGARPGLPGRRRGPET